MLLRQLFTSLFILTAITAFAQNTATVKGTVKDSTGKYFEYVQVTVEEDQKYNAISDSLGHFEIKVPADKKVTLVFSSFNSYTVRGTVKLKPGEVMNVGIKAGRKENIIQDAVIKGKRVEGPTAGTVEIRSQKMLVAPNESFESNLVFQAMGVRNNSELSSAYSVRGGNYDENLVYVNDFEVYRPYLIRSGQQEGLSFINSQMVGNAKFSSGGFQSRYGDKMSSVLDVTYRKPDSLHGNFYGSFLGWGAQLEGSDKKRRFTFSVGVRQRTSQYVLKSLDTKGEYSPNFIDAQAYLTYRVSEKVGLELISNYARNQYSFTPVNRQTDFGLLTDVKRLTIYFDGKEVDKYQSIMNGLSLIYDVRKDVRLKFLTSYYNNREKEAYDILGEYFLSQVESDLSKSNFGQVLYSLGIGGLQDWARNTLNSDIYYAGLRGQWTKKRHNVQWGVDYKHEVIRDKISEWNRLDSAGHSIPYDITNYTDTTIGGNQYYITDKNGIGMDRVLRSTFNLTANRFAGFIQDTWKFGDTSSAKFTFNYGVRFQYCDVNKEPLISPRVQFTYKPKNNSDFVFTAATGLYYQPPFYREMRNDFDSGQVNTSLRAQKSFHVLAGFDYGFVAWKRNFHFTTEAYYKYLWDLVPYQYNDILIRYTGQNQALGYAAGIDMRLNGELAEGAESWIGMSIMSTEQKIPGASYVAYYDSAGNSIANNSANQDRIRSTDTLNPGYFPRPTDQRVSFNLFFQDYIPKLRFIKVHIGLVFASALPFGPPRTELYKSRLRMPPYRRVDIGFSAQLWDPNWAKKKKNTFNQGLKGVWLSLDVFNIFGISNTVSYLWIHDINNTQYAVPNYLSSRRLNAKLTVSF